VLTRINSQSSRDPFCRASGYESACHLAADQVVATVIGVIKTGINDGSLCKRYRRSTNARAHFVCILNGIIKIVMAKSADLARRGIAVRDFTNNAFGLLEETVHP
jgi:hypothetical protein